MPVDAPNDPDVLVNQLALHSAQQNSAVKAFTAQFGDSDGEDSASDSDSLTRERAQEEQLNVRTSEVIGIGSQAPADPDVNGGDGSSLRQESAATERLRRQLLGKHARAPRGALTTGGAMMPGAAGGQKLVASKARPKPPPKRDASDDEEEGRSSISKSRRKQIGDTSTPDNTARADAEEHSATVSSAAATKKRGSSYLDEVLAKRGAKKKRKAKTNGNDEQP